MGYKVDSQTGKYLQKTIELVDKYYDEERERIAISRQRAVWNYEKVDYLPIIVPDKLSADEKSILPDYDYKEMYYDPAKMLIGQIKSVIPFLKSPDDSVASVRVDSGVGTIATTFGVTQEIFSDKMPWVTAHLSKEQIKSKISELRGNGNPHSPTIEMVHSYIEYYKQYIGDKVKIYCSDNQGPIDTAHIVYGDQFFYDVYDDPEFIHSLLDTCTDATIKIVKRWKELIGEPISTGVHSSVLYMGKGGIRICEDTTTLLSAEHISEFCVPYTRRVLNAFSGGWVHYCGRNDALFDVLMNTEEVSAINFGDPQMHDMGLVLRECRKHKKVYFGSVPEQDGEGLEEYFKRILNYLDGNKEGLILQVGGRFYESYSADKIVDTWYQMQDSVLS